VHYDSLSSRKAKFNIWGNEKFMQEYVDKVMYQVIVQWQRTRTSERNNNVQKLRVAKIQQAKKVYDLGQEK
jgi:hypothetical protein